MGERNQLGILGQRKLARPCKHDHFCGMTKSIGEKWKMQLVLWTISSDLVMRENQ